MTTALHPDDNVIMENIGEFGVVCAWNGRKWVIPPGQKASPTFAAACSSFGDPRSVETATHITIQGEVHTIPARRAERVRLKTLMGQHWQAGSEDGFLPDLTPRIHATTLDGEEIPFV